MKTLNPNLKLLLFWVVGGIILASCSTNKEFSFDTRKYYIGGKIEKNSGVFTKVIDDESIKYSFISEVGEIDENGIFKPSIKFLNKKILLPFDKNIIVTIGSYYILNTKIENIKYLVLKGVSFNQNRSYLIAYPISTTPISTMQSITHTCASDDGINICQECEFRLDRDGDIKGCRCVMGFNNNPLGACKHTISSEIELIDGETR